MMMRPMMRMRGGTHRTSALIESGRTSAVAIVQHDAIVRHVIAVPMRAGIVAFRHGRYAEIPAHRGFAFAHSMTLADCAAFAGNLVARGV
jgi:hypothetical protein